LRGVFEDHFLVDFAVEIGNALDQLFEPQVSIGLRIRR